MNSASDNKDIQQDCNNKGGMTPKKVVSLIGNILIYVFCALCVVLLIFSIVSKVNGDDTVRIFGREMRIVVSGSMERNDNTDVSNFKIKSIKTGSIVFIHTVPDDADKADAWYKELQVGDVLTFKYVPANKQETITHRIVGIEHKDSGGYIITLKGDNDNDLQTIDTSIESSPNYVIGKVVGKNFLLGYCIVQLKKPLVMALLVIVPCVIIIIMQVINIVNALNENKRKVAEAEAQQRLNDIDELKRKLAELEGLKSNIDDEQTSNKEEKDG